MRIKPNHHPTNREGLVCWLDYHNSGSVDTNGYWRDFSGQGNDAVLFYKAQVGERGLDLMEPAYSDPPIPAIYAPLARIEPSPSINFGDGDFSVAFKITPSYWQQEQRFFVMSKYDRSLPATPPGWAIFLTSTATAHYFIISMVNIMWPWGQSYAQSNTMLLSGTTYDVVFIRQGVNSYVYINGVLDGTGSNLNGNVDNNQALVLGSRFYDTLDMYGYQNSIQLYNRALPANEIKLNYERNKGY